MGSPPTDAPNVGGVG